MHDDDEDGCCGVSASCSDGDDDEVYYDFCHINVICVNYSK